MPDVIAMKDFFCFRKKLLFKMNAGLPFNSPQYFPITKETESISSAPNSVYLVSLISVLIF